VWAGGPFGPLPVSLRGSVIIGVVPAAGDDAAVGPHSLIMESLNPETSGRRALGRTDGALAP
jgi:hypothetical protein